MNIQFIDRIIPFLNQEVFNQNLLTSYWIIALIAIFLIAILYLIIKLFLIRKNLKIEALSESKRLRKIWHAYQASFSNYRGKKKTIEFAEDYFNNFNILYLSLNIRVVNNVSNTLIGLGILGTFVGLTYGIIDSNFDTAEAIKLSINNLLAGMGMAFVTSIWGMGLSLVFTNIFKFLQTRISRKIQNLCFNLDAEYKLSQEELDKVKEEKQYSVISIIFEEYLVVDTPEGKQLPKNIFRQLLDEAVKQTTSLQSFSDDLGTSIELAMEKLVADNNQQISQLIEDKLVPVLEDLKQIKQDSSAQVIEDAIQKLSTSMKNMMGEFKNSITGDTKHELNELAERLTVVSESLAEVPNTMTDITLLIGETIDALKESVRENIEQSKKEAIEYNRQSQQTFSKATSEYKSTVEDIQLNMELMVNTQKENIQQVSELTGKINTTLNSNSKVNDQFETIIQKSREVAQLIDSSSRKFGENSSSLTESSTILKSSITNFSNTINEYMKDNSELLNQHERTLNNSKDVAETYANKFEIIEEGLKGIFDEIQQGLSEYQRLTGENLNNYLTEFSTVLTRSNESVGNSVAALNEITEELTEQLEKSSRINE